MHPLVREVQKAQLKKVPGIKTGYTIKVHQKVTEGNKERVQIFEGLVIKMGHGEGSEKTFTVRKIVGGIGVEKVFPIHSPNITKIEVRKKAKVRRSKLYYMRDRFGKSARLREQHVTDKERQEEEARMEAMIQEAVEEGGKRKADDAVETESEQTPSEETAEGTSEKLSGSAEKPAEDAETEKKD